MRNLLPYNHTGTAVSPKTPMRRAKIPNGKATPALAVHVPMKNVYAKLMIARNATTIRKQSALQPPCAECQSHPLNETSMGNTYVCFNEVVEADGWDLHKAKRDHS